MGRESLKHKTDEEFLEHRIHKNITVYQIQKLFIENQLNDKQIGTATNVSKDYISLVTREIVRRGLYTIKTH